MPAIAVRAFVELGLNRALMKYSGWQVLFRHSGRLALPAPQTANLAFVAAKMSEFGKSRAPGNLLASKVPKFLGIFVLKTLHI